jgi:hypothetical protein
LYWSAIKKPGGKVSKILRQNPSLQILSIIQNKIAISQRRKWLKIFADMNYSVIFKYISDFPTLALSSSGSVGYSQPLTLTSRAPQTEQVKNTALKNKKQIYSTCLINLEKIL